MKWNTQFKTKTGFGLLIIGLASTAPVMAHPGVVEHSHASGTAHQLIHAIAGLPLVVLVTLFAFYATWPLLCRGSKRLMKNKGGFKQE